MSNRPRRASMIGVFILLGLSMIIYVILGAAFYLDWQEPVATPTPDVTLAAPQATVIPTLSSPTYTSTSLPTVIPSPTKTLTAAPTITSTPSPTTAPTITPTATPQPLSSGDQNPSPNYKKTVSSVLTKTP